MKEKKKPNIVLYTILMFITFFIITEIIIWGYGSTFILDSITQYPQGNLVLSEAVLSLLVLIVMLLFKNSYVFTQKKEKITKGLYYGLFYIIAASLFTLLGIGLGSFNSAPTIFNLVIGCFFVGVAEEFLCRGWLLNEFLERFGDSKKGVWYSIITSGLIFGLMHLGNIYTMGQAVSITVQQVLNAAATGIFLGVIYYKTKNIWSVIALHAFWDFALFLTDVAPVTETTEVIPSINIISFVITLIMIFISLINILPYIKDINNEPSKKTIAKYAIISVPLYILFLSISGIIGSKFGETYEFDSISLEKFEIVHNNYDNYFMNYTNEITEEMHLENGELSTNVVKNDYKFELKENEDKLTLKNITTNYEIVFETEYLYDYIITEYNDYFIIAYVDYRDSMNPYLYYSYVYKNTITNENLFLDNIKNNMKRYLLSDYSILLEIADRDNNTKYLAAYSSDYGYYLLTSQDKMAILNRDK